ncbi:hypothetical protein Pam5_25 [Pseudanabaena phage Pam5]|nr:hypothetical protein Pam5_25 [Pseudanabaena phage Pam5]
MSAGTTAERITRLEEHLRAQDAKLDTIIRLTEAQDERIKVLSARVETMAPTVKAGEDVITTAKTIGVVGRWVLWFSTGLVAFLWYMADRWHLVGQLFKRAG